MDYSYSKTHDDDYKLSECIRAIVVSRFDNGSGELDTTIYLFASKYLFRIRARTSNRRHKPIPIIDLSSAPKKRINIQTEQSRICVARFWSEETVLASILYTNSLWILISQSSNTSPQYSLSTQRFTHLKFILQFNSNRDFSILSVFIGFMCWCVTGRWASPFSCHRHHRSF